MKKVVSVFLSIVLVLSSLAGVLTVSADDTNLWAGIALEDFGTKDTVACSIYFDSFTNSYGKAFHAYNSYYTNFYVKLPAGLEVNTEYELSFLYWHDTIDEKYGTPNIRTVLIATEEQVSAANSEGNLSSTLKTIGSNIDPVQAAYTELSGTFTTTAEETQYYLYVVTDYSYLLWLCNFQLKKAPSYDITVEGGSADKTTAKTGETVTLTADEPTGSNVFTGWEVVSGDVTLADATASTTTFTMPAENVSLKATFDVPDGTNLWAGVDTDWFGTKDIKDSDTDAVPTVAARTDATFSDALTVGTAYYTTFYIKLPSGLKPSTTYELSFHYNNSIVSDRTSSIRRIELLNETQLAAADTDGYGVSGTWIASDLALDQGKWSQFTTTITTGAEETQYYLYFMTSYVTSLYLGGFSIIELKDHTVTVENGTASPAAAKKGATVTVTADEPEYGMMFEHWEVISGSVTLADATAATTTFTMPNEAVSLKAVYRNSGARVAYVTPDGDPYSDTANLPAATAAVAENTDGTHTVALTYDSMDGVNLFLGWYQGDTLLGTETAYTYDPNELDITTVTARILCRNVLTGAAGFEAYESDTNMRVEPIASGVAPYDDKWGLNSGSYETENIGFYIQTTGEKQTTYFTDVGYDRATGTYYDASDVKTAKYLATPHSGNSMLEISMSYRAFVRKLDGLKPNTNYTLSFYVCNPDEYNFLSSAVVMDTYTEKHATLKVMSNRMIANNSNTIYGYYEADRTEELFETNVTITDRSSVRSWQKVSFTFTTGNNTDSLYLYLASRNRNTWWNRCAIYVDDLVCYENAIPYVGNAMRATSATLPQALRYKFRVNNAYLTDYHGNTFEKLGLLVMPEEYLNGAALELDQTYAYNGANKKPINATVEAKNYQYQTGDTENTYFTAALHNIGQTDSGTDYTQFDTAYTVRPYSLYTDANGVEFVIYGDPVTVSVFDVIYAIRDAATSQTDLDIVNGILELPAAKVAYTAWQPADGWNITNENAPVSYDYSFAVVGDIQYTTQLYPDDLAATYDWILNNQTGKKIEYVFGAGDITNNSTQAEFTAIDAQLQRLQGKIPQTVIRGNHDSIAGYDAAITADKYKAGGDEFVSYDGTMKTYYRKITIGGIKYMMLTLDYFPSVAEVTWAKTQVDANQDYNVIVTTHGYLKPNMTLIPDEEVYDVEDRVDAEGNAIGGVAGQYIYDNLIVPCSNIVMVLCGHEFTYGPEYNVLTREDGTTAVQMMVNFQQEEYLDLRSYGMIAMLYFGDGGETVTVEWFSSIKNEYYMDKYQFTFKLNVIQ